MRRDLSRKSPKSLVARVRPRLALQHQRHDDVVRHHDRQRDAFHDHHGGRRRQTADENAEAEQMRIGFDRQRQHIHVAVGGAERKGDQAGQRDRDHEQVDGDQIERKQPARAADFGVAGVLDDADVKLPRQHHDRAERQQRGDEEIADRRHVVDGAHRLRRLHRAFDQLLGREHPKSDERAGGDERHQFHDRFGGDRQHQAMLMLGGVGVTGPEQHRERRHRQGHHQCDVADQRNLREGIVLAQDGFERPSHGLELQRDIGHRADDRDQRDGGGDRLALAIARANEIGDRGDVLRLREPDHAAQQRRAEPDHQDRAGIDREEIDTGAGGGADRAKERPGGAIDRERQRIDQPAGTAALRRREAVAIACDHEQQADIDKRRCNHAPVVEHRWSLPLVRSLARDTRAGRNLARCPGPGDSQFPQGRPGSGIVVKAAAASGRCRARPQATPRARR